MACARAALNLARERAEDAEAGLAEARRELALEAERADSAEREPARLLAGEERQPTRTARSCCPRFKPAPGAVPGR